MPKEVQKRFTDQTKSKYGQSGEHDKTYDPFSVVGLVFHEEKKAKVKKDVARLYGQLCNYSHPNFIGWKELVRIKEDAEMIERFPSFSSINGENSIGLLLFLMQMTFKGFVETFGCHLIAFAIDLDKWQRETKKLLIRLTPQN